MASRIAEALRVMRQIMPRKRNYVQLDDDRPREPPDIIKYTKIDNRGMLQSDFVPPTNDDRSRSPTRLQRKDRSLVSSEDDDCDDDDLVVEDLTISISNYNEEKGVLSLVARWSSRRGEICEGMRTSTTASDSAVKCVVGTSLQKYMREYINETHAKAGHGESNTPVLNVGGCCQLRFNE